MPLPENIRTPLVDDQTEGFDEPIKVNEEGIAAAGFYPQNATSTNGNAGVYRDSSENLVFKDANVGVKTLAQLVTGGASFGSPVSVGIANADGTSALTIRADHVHAHGAQTDSSLHAEATAGAAGFISSADKSKLDSITVANLPTAAEKAAMAGTSTNAPSASNRFVDNLDSRLSNSRTPIAHAASHAVGGSDPVTLTSAAISDFSTATKTVLGTSVVAGTGISTSINPTTKVLTVSNAGVTSVNGSTGAVAGLVTTATTVSAGIGLSGGGDLSANRTLSMPNVGTAGTYGSAASVPVMTTDAQGRVSGVTATNIAVAQSAVTSLVTDLAAKAADSAVVHVSGNETIAGVKTFSSSPTVPTPSASGDAASKNYVDTQMAAVSGNYAAPVQTVADLRAVTSAQYADKQLRLLEDLGAIYRFDTTGVGTDNSDGIIKPTDVTTGTGRWFKVTAATQDHEGLSGLLGGDASDHQHLTTAQLSVVTGATSTNTASALVLRDGSGNFSAGVITASLSGAASSSGSAAILNDIATNSTHYPTFVSFSSGNQIVKTSNTKLTYNPSTGRLSATSFGGSGAGLTSIPNAATTATSVNSLSAIVARDSGGNFSAGTITAALSGNASTATKLQTARTINGISFDGSANITVPASNSTLTAGSYLTGTSYNGSAAVTFAVDATTAATASKVVARDASSYVSANGFTFNGHTVTDPQVYSVRGSDLTIATNNTTTTIVTSDTLQPNAIYVYDIRMLMFNTSVGTNSAVNSNISLSQQFQWLNYSSSYSTMATGFSTSYITSGSASALMPTHPFNTHWWYVWSGVLKTHATLTSTISGTFSYSTAVANMFIARAASYASITRVA